MLADRGDQRWLFYPPLGRGAGAHDDVVLAEVADPHRLQPERGEPGDSQRPQQCGGALRQPGCPRRAGSPGRVCRAARWCRVGHCGQVWRVWPSVDAVRQRGAPSGLQQEQPSPAMALQRLGRG